MKRLKIMNAQAITPEGIIGNSCVIVENGKISLVAGKDVSAGDCKVVDAGGNYIAPGFVDIHTHGAGGHDFMDNTVEAYLGAARSQLIHGTTSVCPTTLASGIDELKGTFETFRRAKKMNKEGARFLGMHLEGPYFALSQKGAQDPRFIKNPEPEEYKKILEWTGDIIRWSAAPELEGALEFAEYLRAKGILPSIAHTDATYEQVLKAFDSGFTHITHFYNATSGVRKINAYRYAGVIESGYLIDDMTVEVIADGCHLPGSLLKLVYKIKGSEKTALVTDSMRAAGMPEGESILGSLKEGQRVLVEDGVAKMPDRTSFAGSVATTDRLVRTMVRQAGVPLTEAVKMMTQTPAKIIGASERIGSLSKGYNADLVVFDKDINIKTVILDGIVVYEV